MNQIGLFDGSQPLKITKPIRLIECFAGYGSQALSLKYLGADFERVARNQSNSSLYHLAGDSIITNCLMAIFKEML